MDTAVGAPGHIPGVRVTWCPQQGCKLGAGRETQLSHLEGRPAPPPERCVVSRGPLALGSALHTDEGTNTSRNETRFKNYCFVSAAPACPPRVFREVSLTVGPAWECRAGEEGVCGGVREPACLSAEERPTPVPALTPQGCLGPGADRRRAPRGGAAWYPGQHRACCPGHLYAKGTLCGHQDLLARGGLCVLPLCSGKDSKRPHLEPRLMACTTDAFPEQPLC